MAKLSQLIISLLVVICEPAVWKKVKLQLPIGKTKEMRRMGRMSHIIAHPGPIFFMQKPRDFCEALTKKKVPTWSDICFMSLPDTHQPCVGESSQSAKWQE